MRVLGVVSARPNFVKMAPVVRALAARGADRLYVTEPSGSENLCREGIGAERVGFAGNTMIDTLDACRGLADRQAGTGGPPSAWFRTC